MNNEQILFEDKDVIVCHKLAGIATQTAKIGQRDMVSEVTNYLTASSMPKEIGARQTRQNKSKPYVGLIHRLDQPVEGILVFAKNPKAAAALSKQISGNQMQKCYYAVVLAENFSAKESDSVEVCAHGNTTKGVLIDYLYKDGKTNTSSVVPKEHKDAKRAELSYELIKEQREKGIALVKIKLVTGRHHQIRVQMSHAGMSLIGDYKYADEKTKQLSEELGQKQVALCAYELGFLHPMNGKELVFRTKPTGEIFQNFL